MLVVAIASQKGGSGKTTLCGHLAVEAEKSGAGPVALIDTDPQGSLSQWWNARAAKSPSFAKVGAFELASALAHLKRTGIKLAIIDTPPAITDSISQVISHSDLVIVPTRPSPHDLRAVGATVDIAERFKKALIFVMNGATARARITGESAVALSQHGTVAPSTIHHRVDFAASMVDGRTVGEVVPKSASTKEISDLWTYVQDRLVRLVQDPSTAEVPPEPFAISSLSTPQEEEENELVEATADTGVEERPVVIKPVVPEFATIPVHTPPLPEFQTIPVHTPDLPYLGPDRRSGPERREREPALRDSQALFNRVERRVNTFGRRHTD
jgi:chromosome partitioning protein